ncbi:hypothetical protein [Companilactobacillus jidongensis]|uniref:hypothetical protein n=1 Tax=Companilactobacillus jidongensis TaxID=2486006 RepID=UPI000F7A9B2F|nr:hypothetical protein [Companilactobacillus jidongensis]
MLRKGKVMFLFLFSFLLTIGLFFGHTNVVKAWNGYYDSDAMGVAPTGIVLNNLTDPSTSLFVGGRSTGFTPTVINDNNGNASVLKLGGSSGAVTSAWSNLNAGNYIDVTKKQDLSFWVYLGDSSSNTDGMAFVLQNDKNATNAISADSSGIVGGQTLGVWGVNSSANKNATAIAASAIQNSWALEFDNFRDGPKELVDRGTASLGSSFDTYFGEDSNGYNGRSLGDQHTGWNYSGDPNSYRLISSASKGIFQLTHNNAENLELTGLSSAASGWHHVMIDYTPPATKGGDAILKYSFNTKDANGHKTNPNNGAPTGQNPVYENIPDLHTSVFKLGDSDKLRFGFTSSTGTRSPGSTWVVFESIPAIVQAQSTAYAIDKTSESRIDTDTSDTYPNYIEDEDQALPTTASVHPGDDLKFKYGIKYESGKQPAKSVVATLNLPDNVTFGSSDGTSIGKVTYVSKDGKSTKNESLMASDVSGSTLTYDVEDLDDTNDTDWVAVKIELDGTANDIPSESTSLKVPVSHVNFTGTNYISDAQTYAFNIVQPSDTLNITKDDPDPQTIYTNGTANLNGHLSFASGKAITNTEDYDIHYSINGGADVLGHGDSTDPTKFSVPINGSDLKVGTNDITVQVVYTNYKNASGNIETIASKKIHYTVNLKTIALVATADMSPITVLNNTSVAMPSITIGHNDGSSLEGGSDPIVNYTVSNPNYNSGQVVSGKADSLQMGESGSKDIIHFNMNKAADDSTAGLRVGENTINVTITDPGGHVSNTLKFVINVQDINPALSYGDGTDGNITVDATDNTISLPINVKYDGKENFKPSDLSWSMTVDNNSVKFPTQTSSTSMTSYDFTQDFTRAELGIDKDNSSPTHTIVVQATDPYGRVSNKQTYTLKMNYKSASITYNNSYSFGALNQSPEKRLVHRTNDWAIDVDTVDSQYKLTADASSLTTSDPNNNLTLDGELVYVDPTTGNVESMTDPVELSENDTDTTGKHGISNGWEPNKGILLQLNANAPAGSYRGKINWNLVDSVE